MRNATQRAVNEGDGCVRGVLEGRPVVAAVLTGLLAVGGLSAARADAPPAATVDDVERMQAMILAMERRHQEELAAMKAHLKTLTDQQEELAEVASDLVEPAPVKSDKPEFTINAFASFEMEYQIDSEGNGDPNGSFDNDQIDIVLGYAKDNFRLIIDLLYEHGAASEDDFGNVGLAFGFAEYAFSNSLSVRAGKYYSPYGTYNEYNSAKTAFLPVKIPLSTNKPDSLTGNGYRFFPRRQAGLGILGARPMGDGLISYDLAVSNGSQDETNPFEEDNNTQKAFIGRVRYEGLGDWIIGASAYADHGAEGGNINSLALHAEYEGDTFQLSAEADFGTLDLDQVGEPDIDQLGGYVELGLPLDNGLTPYLQYQYVETEAADLEQSAFIVIAGLNYVFRDYAHLKFENAYHKGSTDNTRFNDLSGRDYNELRAAIVLGF